MKKTLLSIVSLFFAAHLHADVLWTTELAAAGAQEVVTTDINGQISAPSASYDGGWFCDWYGGEGSSLKFHQLGGNYIVGSNSVGVGDAIFNFTFRGLKETATLEAIRVGTFTWEHGGYTSNTLGLHSCMVSINGEVVYHRYSGVDGKYLFQSDFIENGSPTSYIEIPIPPTAVGPGDVIYISVDVTGYKLGCTNIGLYNIVGVGTAN